MDEASHLALVFGWQYEVILGRKFSPGKLCQAHFERLPFPEVAHVLLTPTSKTYEVFKELSHEFIMSKGKRNILEKQILFINERSSQ